jgi:putative transposase
MNKKTKVGDIVFLNKQKCEIVKIVNASNVSVRNFDSNVIQTLNISSLDDEIITSKNETHSLEFLTDDQWEKAKQRLEILRPILDNPGKLHYVEQQARLFDVSIPTLYRWVALYKKRNVTSDLLGKPKSGGKGKNRLPKKINKVIESTISRVYLNKQRSSIPKLIREVKMKCSELGLTSPHENTIRNRLKSLSEESIVKARMGKNFSKQLYEPHRGKFPDGDGPLCAVQIDHTLLDIILVDESNRTALSRPWITVAIDVFSRMILGLYISYETPGTHGTGLCLSNAILPKDSYLDDCSVSGDWPCWGIMENLFMDNAKEFKGKSLKRSLSQYGVGINFRPVGKPQWGGHIERLLGNFSKEIHNLPGTTFSNTEERGRYNSEKKATFTLSEFETWLVEYIVNIYHRSNHSGINQTPLSKWEDGVKLFGMPKLIYNKRQVELDFMPYVERTIQEYGVVIDHIEYYDDVLRSFVNTKEGRIKRKFIFKRDPRDLSKIFFFHPDLEEYFNIPYRDATLPSISRWEFNYVKNKLKRNKFDVNQEQIFETFRKLNEIENNSLKKTQKRKRKIKSNSEPNKKITGSVEVDLENLKPFEEIE